jgi:putative transposase
VVEEVKAWQARPLEPIYPIVYVDALVVKVRDGHQVRNRSAHIAVGVDLDGIKHVLGIWVQATEGAKFWAGVVAELANRGVRDILIACCLIACCDGLTGLPEAIEATFPHATVQTCAQPCSPRQGRWRPRGQAPCPALGGRPPRQAQPGRSMPRLGR